MYSTAYNSKEILQYQDLFPRFSRMWSKSCAGQQNSCQLNKIQAPVEKKKKKTNVHLYLAMHPGTE